MDSTYRRKVTECIANRPYLHALFTNAHDIPEQVYAYDNEMFVVYNGENEKYEIHSLGQTQSFCLTVPFRQLDRRAIIHLWKQDLRVHGKEIFRRLDEAEDREKKRKARKFHNWVEDVGSETRSMFAKDSFEAGL